jgi:hypothetical protein
VVSTNSVDTWKGKTAAAGTPNIGGPLTGDFGRGTDEVDILGIVTQTFTSAGAATLQIQVIQADDAALTVNVEMLRESRHRRQARSRPCSPRARCSPWGSRRR